MKRTSIPPLLAGLALLGCAAAAPAQEQGPLTAAQTAALAPTPPMGWNSWDSYGPTVTEKEVKANADYMAQHLSSFGWKYIVVDVEWYEPGAKAHGYRMNPQLTMDDYGRLMPAVNRFPSAANGRGFGPLADYVHSKGLLFGIHVMRGIPQQAVQKDLPIFGSQQRAADVANLQSPSAFTTDMYGIDPTKPGGQDYYDSIAKLYASWGVDYIKADDMVENYHGDEIEALSRAIAHCGRPIVLSLSPGPAPLDKAKDLAAHAQLWRISGDVRDNWSDVKRAFTLCRRWAGYGGPGHWPDADMLPLGRIGIHAQDGNDRASQLNHSEQTTLMTLWSIFHSPLMFGGDLPSNDDFTVSLLTNPEVLAVDQGGGASRELFWRGDSVAWVSEIPGSKDVYLALFNIGDNDDEVSVNFTGDLGTSETCGVRNLWTQSDLGTVDATFSPRIPRHGAGLYRLTPL